jgi:hypothetical protein
MNKQIIQDILDKYNTFDFKIIKFKNIELPINVDIKNCLFYFLMFKWYENNNDDYCKQLLDFVLIPNIDYDFNNFNSIKEYIEIHKYIKYNINNKNICLKFKIKKCNFYLKKN